MPPHLVKIKGLANNHLFSKRLNDWGRIALDLLFPQRCIGCGKEGNLLCSSCLFLLPRITPPLCPLCGSPQSSGILCPNCISCQTQIDGIRSPFRFDKIIRQAIHQLKYQNLRALAIPLAGLLADYLVNNSIPGEVLVPVPLHNKRLRERGYNQSYLLSREISKLTGLPVIDDCIIRVQHTPPQARTLTVNERRSNVASAFTCRDHRFRGKEILLIDDVSTSGATLNACAATLKAAGASSVWGLTLAKEI